MDCPSHLRRQMRKEPMIHSEWLRNVLQNGSIEVSDSVRSALSLFATLDEETLWQVLVLLSACYSDLAKAGHINSWPANMDPLEAARIFMHLSSTTADVAFRLSGPGREPSVSPVSALSIPQEEL